MSLAKSILLILVIPCTGGALAQKKPCAYSDGLSNKYDYSIAADKKDEDAGKVILTVVSKEDKTKKQVLVYQPQSWDMLQFTCECRSYITGLNKDAEVEDGDYGDIVIADLNFDGREDIAARDESTNGYGQLYRFFFQDDKGNFIEQHDFLSQGQDDYIVRTLPVEINAQNKTLTFWSHPDAFTGTNTVFGYNATTHKWEKEKVVDDIYENGEIIKSVIEKN